MPCGVSTISSIVFRSARCSRSSNLLSALQAASFFLPFSGRGKKLLPFSANDPFFPPSMRLRTAYFQYAVCSVSSQMLCRPAPGRQAACLALTPRIDCLRFGPCQVFFSYASSSIFTISSRVFTVSSLERKTAGHTSVNPLHARAQLPCKVVPNLNRNPKIGSNLVGGVYTSHQSPRACNLNCPFASWLTRPSASGSALFASARRVAGPRLRAGLALFAHRWDTPPCRRTR